HSPNVADEWETALKRGVPVILFVAENVDFTPYSVPNAARVLPLDKLKASAAAVIDSRWRFGYNVKRLGAILHTQLDHAADAKADPAAQDRIGLPKSITVTFRNRSIFNANISTVVPPPVTFVSFALLYNLLMIGLVSVVRFSFWWQTVIVSFLVFGL